MDHPGNPALAKAARHENPIHVAKPALGSGWRIEILCLHPLHNHTLPIGQAAMGKGLAEALVRVFELHVFSDDADAHLSLRILESL